MKNFINIGSRRVGADYPPFVIAEIGINHGGSIDVAKEMVDAAFKSGIECIKHQTHIIDDEMSREAKKVIPGNSDISIYEIMKNCALDEKDEIELKNYVESKGMIFISTPFSRAAADRLERMNVDAYKIGSGECNNYPLLEHISNFKKPVILSTGMNSIQSVQKAVKIFENSNVPLALLHTTNLYPTPYHLVRFGAMKELANAFPNHIFGLSDHTVTNHACFGAVALGASILERHFTDHKDRNGPDIICSMDQADCKDLVEGSNYIWQMRGGKKEATKEEKVTIDFAFATVVTIKNIKKGEKFTKENLWVKRPGTGEIAAEDFNKIIGKNSSQNLECDQHLKWEHVEK